MKKLQKLLILIVVISCYGCCITKPEISSDGGNFTFGPELSYRTSSYWGDDSRQEDLKHVGSINFGIFGHWIFCEDYPNMGLYSGLFYNRFGAKYDYEGENSSSRIRLSYLTIPFTFTYHVYDGFSAEVGPDLSFLLGAKEVYKYEGSKDTYDIKEDISNVQLGFNIGLSYNHEETGLGGFIRYNGGFTTVPSSEDDLKIYNGGINFGVRYRLNRLLSMGEN